MKRPCGKFLKAGVDDWLGVVAEEYKFSEQVVTLLSEISASSIDRLLRGVKVTKGLSATRSGGFRDEIPIQGNIWNIEFPGHTEFDTVAHCGGSLMGEYINSVVGTDIATTWTEARTTFGRGSGGVFECIKDMEKSFPFDIIGYDAEVRFSIITSVSILPLSVLKQENHQRKLLELDLTRKMTMLM